MFSGFASERIATSGGAEIFVRHAGKGRPILFLHGAFQTSACFHRLVMPMVADYHVVCADLRGYGRSIGPVGTSDDHEEYSFRAMARDQIELMRHLGHDRFAVVGHDRGGRVVHRLCLDSPAAVEAAVVLDILPTHHMLTRLPPYWQWEFYRQPNDLPERMLLGVPADWFLSTHFVNGGLALKDVEPAAFAEYVECLNWKSVHAMCEDYRATYGCGKAHDLADRDRSVEQPLLVLYGKKGKKTDAEISSIWSEYAPRITVKGIDAGHYLPEQAAEDVRHEICDFLVRTGAA